MSSSKRPRYAEEIEEYFRGIETESLDNEDTENTPVFEETKQNIDNACNEDKTKLEKCNKNYKLKTKYNKLLTEKIGTANTIHNECSEIPKQPNGFESTGEQQFLEQKHLNTDKCSICGQYLHTSNMVQFSGHPQNALEESIALTNDELLLTCEGKKMARPHVNLTRFSIYDEKGHLCPIEGGLLDKHIRILMSGYLEPKYSESHKEKNPIPVKNVGPILHWFISSIDGGKKYNITLSTTHAEYTLLKPHDSYKQFMDNLYEKIWLTKIVVKYLEKFYYKLPTYEELLSVVQSTTIPDLDNKPMTEETLHKHAQFLCDQVASIDSHGDDYPLITLPCMRQLIRLLGINFSNNQINTKTDYVKKFKKDHTKATTTPLVRKTFKNIFMNQLDKTDSDIEIKKQRCGVCNTCQLTDCGECNACQAMPKFGGKGKSKKPCVLKLCPNRAIEETEDSEVDNEDNYEQLLENIQRRHMFDEPVPLKRSGLTFRKIKWIGKPTKIEGTKFFYEKVEIDDRKYCIGDFVMVEPAASNVPSLIVRLVYMWQDKLPQSGYFHGEAFMRSSDTVLGEIGNPKEVFLADNCSHEASLSCILKKTHVEKNEISIDSFKQGGKDIDDVHLKDDGETYFFSKFYHRFTARFEDLPKDPICPNAFRKHRYCPSCERKSQRRMKYIPKLMGRCPVKSALVMESRTEWSILKWQDVEYKKGCGVFLKPKTFKLKNCMLKVKEYEEPQTQKVDENIYTEYYRKNKNILRGSNMDTGAPFCIGYIAAITAIGSGSLTCPQNIYLKVNVMYRPENTKCKFPQYEDANMVYWSDDVFDVCILSVIGPCNLIYEKNIPKNIALLDWVNKDPNRFYFSKAYNKEKGQIINVPEEAKHVGWVESYKFVDNKEIKIAPLKTLDIFAGCGGLSEGLHQAGLAECKWAVENDAAAAQAYYLNNNKCLVFHEDCNVLLKEVMSGSTHSTSGLRLPAQGEVELLCGGPPCQGFSGMNRFSSGEYSKFKNSLIATCLSYCDYYRPKYFIMENVRNFVAFKKGMVLKLTVQALLSMGYQCTYGILQAGHYGVPQTRRRLILLAAAPGYALPLFPSPTHVFSKRACFLQNYVDGKRFNTNVHWQYSAPMRNITIEDAMNDLPEISNGANEIEIDYDCKPLTHFQRMMRGKDLNAKLRDHICKNMTPLVHARICHVPKKPGSDWRDLPNISVTLSDGTKCKALEYRYRNTECNTNAVLRSVCACAEGRPCNPEDKQFNTMIPWCLPHTANRHSNWTGLYGRLSWTGYFSTTVTDPEPIGTQGCVLHPSQDRVVSVRECARSQGFHDTFMFYGTIYDKYRQIGNAVPPPMALALGREIMKALAFNESNIKM